MRDKKLDFGKTRCLFQRLHLEKLWILRKSYDFDVNGVGLKFLKYSFWSFVSVNSVYFLLPVGLLSFTVARDGSILPSSVKH